VTLHAPCFEPAVTSHWSAACCEITATPDLVQSSCSASLPLAPLGIVSVTAATPAFAGVKSISHGVARTPPAPHVSPVTVTAGCGLTEGPGVAAGLRARFVGVLGAVPVGSDGVCCMLHAVSAIAAIGAKRRGLATLYSP